MVQRLLLRATGLAPLALVAASPALAGSGDEPAAPARDTFAAPVRLDAGDRPMGEGRLYPSPVLHDVDGDGLADVVVGDLWGKLTVARRLPGEGAPRFGAETWMKDLEGEDIDFNNW